MAAHPEIEIKPDALAASQFLTMIQPKGLFALVEFNGEKPRACHIVRADQVHTIDKILQRANIARRSNLYVVVNEVQSNFDGLKPTDADIISVRAVVCDVDVNLAEPRTKRHADDLLASWCDETSGMPKPTAVIRTGDSGGLHAWFVLEDALPVIGAGAEDARDLIRGIGASLKTQVGGDSVFDLSRLMRLPGSLNVPSAKKRASGREIFQTALIKGDGARWSLERLRQTFPPKVGSAPGAPSGARALLVEKLDAAGVFSWASMAQWAAENEASSTRLAVARMDSRFLDDMLLRGPAAIDERNAREGRADDASGSGLILHVAVELARSGLFRDDVEIAAICELADHGGHEKPNHRGELAGAVIAARAHTRTFGEAFVPGALPGWVDVDAALRTTTVVGSRVIADGRRFTFQTASEARSAYKPRTWLVRHLIPDSGSVVWFGPPEAKKSFAAVDLAFHLSEGLDWFGQRSKRCGVAMWSGEGVPGLRARLRGWLDEHPACNGDGFAAFSDQLNLHTESERGLIERFKLLKEDFNQRCGLELRLAIFDTASKASLGADDNSSKDVASVMRKLERVGQECGIVTLVIHHSGKDESRGARGSSVWLANADGVVEFLKDGAFISRKSKDGPGSIGFKFSTKVVSLDQDEFGEMDSTLVIVPGEPMRKDQSSALEKLSAGSQDAINALTSAYIANGAASVTLSAVERAAQGLTPDRPVNGDSLRIALKRLSEKNLIQKWGTGRGVTYAPKGQQEPYVRPELDLGV